MNNLIEKISEYKNAIKNAIITKYKEINSDESEINPGDDLSAYASVIRDYLSVEFEKKFQQIGYKGIPEELLLTLQGQASYIASSNTPENRDKSKLSKALFVGANFVGDLNNNRRCILIFTDSLEHIRAFNGLKSLQEIFVLDDASDLKSYKETKINTYWFFRDTTQIEHIYAILDMIDYGYTIETLAGGTTRGSYFFSGSIRAGNDVDSAIVPVLKTLYMKNIHRAYNFSKSPLSMESVLYCINNALHDADYANNAEKNYKFTLKSSAYTEEEKAQIAQAVLNRGAELSDTGLNMEIVFA